MKKSLNPCSKDSHRLSHYKGSPCVTTEIITDKFDVFVVDSWEIITTSILNHSDFPGVDHEDVKLVGYDFRGHTRGTLVVGIAYGCPYYKGSAIFSLVFLSTTSEKSFIP